MTAEPRAHASPAHPLTARRWIIAYGVTAGLAFWIQPSFQAALVPLAGPAAARLYDGATCGFIDFQPFGSIAVGAAGVFAIWNRARTSHIAAEIFLWTAFVLWTGMGLFSSLNVTE
ncbi:MAG: hypothetical protein R3F17_02825 [Planctomycetota bacterium]